MDIQFHFNEIKQYKDSMDNIFSEIGTVPSHVRQSKKIILCFINRSGSNYLAELMHNTKRMGNAQEYMNENTVQKNKNIHNLSSLAGYIAHLYKISASENNVFSIQLGMHQLIYLLENNEKLSLFDENTYYIYINRSNSILQSISYYKAIETNAYTSLQKEQKTDIELNIDKIIQIYFNLLKRKIMFENIFNVYDIPKHTVTYEELVKFPFQHIINILEYCNVSYLKKEIVTQTKLKKQGNNTNLIWEEKIRRELKKTLLQNHGY